MSEETLPELTLGEISANITHSLESTYTKPKRDSNKSRIYFALILASNSIGISSLAYPSVVANSGIITFFLLTLLALVINYKSGYLLVYCAKIKEAKNYGDLTKIMLGKSKIIVDIAFFITNIGIILSCILTFNDFMSGIFLRKIGGESNKIFSNKESLFWIIFPNLVLLPVLLRNNMKDMSLFSAIAVLAIFILAIFSIFLFQEKMFTIEYSELNLFSGERSSNGFILLLFGYMN